MPEIVIQNYEREILDIVQSGITRGILRIGAFTSFLTLSDVPHSYSGEAAKIVAVKAAEDGLEFVTATSIDQRVKVSATDSANDFLEPKLTAGTGITITKNTAAGVETLAIACSITQYTDELAQDAVGGILTDTATIDFTYNDGTPSITADVKTNSISNSLLRQSAALSVVGNATNATANVADISAGTDHQVLRRSGTAIAFGAVDLGQAAAITGTLPIGNGGTGQTTASAAFNALSPMSALGDIIYGGASGAGTRLSGNTTTTRKFLRQTGDGVNSAAPAWDTLLAADVPGSALTKTDDTNVTLTLGGTPTTALLVAASLTLGWTGQLAVTRGGTGLATIAQGDLLYGSAANTLAALAKDATATRYLSNTGASNNPAWAQVNLANGVTGTLPIANGGTGQTTAANAINALLPTQTGHAGEFLTTDGSVASWSSPGGSGTVNSGAAGALAYYPTATTLVDDLAMGTANQVLGMNAAANGYEHKTMTEGEAIDISHAANAITIACEDASVTNKGVAELATDAETLTGTDTVRTLTPSNLEYARSVSGWTPVTGTFTYASATTINVSSGAASLYSIGDKLRFQNNDSGTYLYVYIVTVADTLLTVVGDAVPNATLTDAYYSHAESPLGFPSSFTWTPTIGGFNPTPGASYAKFSLTGKRMHISFACIGTSNSTGFTFTLPVASTTQTDCMVRVANNGAFTAAAGLIEIAGGSATANVYLDGAGNVFTASGTKAVQSTFSYFIA